MKYKIITSGKTKVEIENGQDIIVIQDQDGELKVRWQTMDNKSINIELIDSNSFKIKKI